MGIFIGVFASLRGDNMRPTPSNVAAWLAVSMHCQFVFSAGSSCSYAASGASHMAVLSWTRSLHTLKVGTCDATAIPASAPRRECGSKRGDWMYMYGCLHMNS